MITTVVLSIIIFIHLFAILKYYRFSKKLDKTPFYNRALVGMYVKFKGKIKSVNNLKVPITDTDCEFFRFKVTGFRSVKIKSPGKGYETIVKPLYREVSEEPFLLTDNNQEVWVASSVNKADAGSAFKINKEITSSVQPKEGYPSEAMYSNYDYEAEYLSADDNITVYGKLIQKDDKFIITDTFSPKFPFIIFIGDYLSLGSFYRKNFKNRALSVIIATMLLIYVNLFQGFNFLLLFFIAVVLYIGIIRISKSLSLIFKSNLSKSEKEARGKTIGSIVVFIIISIFGFFVFLSVEDESYNSNYSSSHSTTYHSTSYSSGGSYSSSGSTLKNSGTSFRNRSYGSGK